MNLFTFTTKTGQPQRFTNDKSDRDIEVNGLMYRPMSISRSPYAVDTLKAKNNIIVTVPGDTEFFRPFLATNPDQLLVDIAEATGAVFFRGELIEVRWQKFNILMTFAPILRIRKTLGERRLYQRNCPYELYGKYCLATKIETMATVTTITSSTNVTVTVDTGDTSNDQRDDPYDIVRTPVANKLADVGLLTGGLLRKDTISWWIISARPTTASGAIVTIVINTFRSHNLQVNDTVNLALGCRRDLNDCERIFNNKVRFGGFAAMNKISPFDGGLAT